MDLYAILSSSKTSPLKAVISEAQDLFFNVIEGILFMKHLLFTKTIWKAQLKFSILVELFLCWPSSMPWPAKTFIDCKRLLFFCKDSVACDT